MVAGKWEYFQYHLGKFLYRSRGHDLYQIMYSDAFGPRPQPTIVLEATDVGDTGSVFLDMQTCLNPNGRGRLPALRWNPPVMIDDVKEYVLICEDLDSPIPCHVVHHGLFYGIPPGTTSATDADILVKADSKKKERLTEAGWNYVPNMAGNSYQGPTPLLGHGEHRYVFTIIAINEKLKFKNPNRVSLRKIKKAINGKVIGWGSWTGIFERPFVK